MSISNKAKEDGCREPACSKGELVQDDEAGESGDLPVLLPGGDSDCGFLKKCLLVVGGLGLVVIGIIGLILPILIGVPFLIAGLSMLSVVFKPLRKWVNLCEAKLPRKWRLYIRSKMRREAD